MAAGKNQEMKRRLLAERDLLLRQREAIDNQIAGLERAIALIGDESATDQRRSAGAGRRTATKSVVLDLLRDVGTTGLSAQSAVDLANNRGITLDRASVSSLLSRLKSEGTLVYDGERYRLKEFAQAIAIPSVAVITSSAPQSLPLPPMHPEFQGAPQPPKPPSTPVSRFSDPPKAWAK